MLITVRGDSGFGTPLMYKTCDDLRMTFTIGMGMNPRLKKISEDLLAQAVKTYAETQTPQRLFLPIEYQADSWPAPRPVVIKVEANAQGTNRRAVGIRPVNRILHGGVKFPETRGTRFRRHGDGDRATEGLAGSGEGAALATDGAAVAQERAERPRILRLAGAVGALLLCLAA